MRDHRRKRTLLSGDHLLPGITPPVTFERGFDADPLRSYLTSLRAVADLRPRTVLPGHGTPFGDPQGRIEAILRSVLRAGAWELETRTDIPARVIVSEYVDVAHAFVDKTETGMVNAVLDQLARKLRGGEFGCAEPSDPAGS